MQVVVQTGQEGLVAEDAPQLMAEAFGRYPPFWAGAHLRLSVRSNINQVQADPR